MKITMNVECTPEEARHFIGLPDVKPMQDALMADLEKQMRGALQSFTPEGMMKAWTPGTANKGVDQMQKLFWSQMQQMFGSMMGSSNLLISPTDKKKDAA